MLFQAPNAPKPIFGRGAAPDHTGGAYDAPPDPVVCWGGDTPPLLPLSRSSLGAYGASILRPHQ